MIQRSRYSMLIPRVRGILFSNTQSLLLLLNVCRLHWPCQSIWAFWFYSQVTKTWTFSTAAQTIWKTCFCKETNHASSTIKLSKVWGGYPRVCCRPRAMRTSTTSPFGRRLLVTWDQNDWNGWSGCGYLWIMDEDKMDAKEHQRFTFHSTCTLSSSWWDDMVYDSTLVEGWRYVYLGHWGGNFQVCLFYCPKNHWVSGHWFGSPRPDSCTITVAQQVPTWMRFRKKTYHDVRSCFIDLYRWFRYV